MASRNFNFDLIKISHPVLLSSTPNSQEPLPFLCQQTDKNLRDIPEAPSLDPVPCPPLVLLPTASSPGPRALLGLTTPLGGIFFLILLSAKEFCSFCFFSPQKARRSGESYTLNGRSLERLSPPRKPHRMLLDVSMLWVTDKSRRRTSNHAERAGREKRHMESVSQSGDSAHSGNGTKTRMWESTKSIY